MPDRYTHWNQWSQWHGLTQPFALCAALAVVIATLLCHVGLPPISPVLSEENEQLQVVGMGAIAAAAPLFTLPLRSAHSWIETPYASLLRARRLTWFTYCLGFFALCVTCSGVLLPHHISFLGEYAPICFLWFGASSLALCFTTTTSATLLPFGLVLVHMLRVIPWEFNLIFNPRWTLIRAVLAAIFLSLALLAYTARGARIHQ